MKPVLLSLLLFAWVQASAQTVKFSSKKEASYANGVHKWTLEVDSTDSSFNEIAYIEYNLDASRYKDPVRPVNERENRYAITVFGAFPTEVEPVVYFKDGHSEKYSEELTIIDTTQFRLANKAQRRDERNWNWQAFIVADTVQLNRIEYVEYLLHPSFRNNVQRIYERGNDLHHGFRLDAAGWGTFLLKAKVVMRDGRAAYLEHELVFTD